jgi:DNA-binding MarR family transcriptional regulator
MPSVNPTPRFFMSAKDQRLFFLLQTAAHRLKLVADAAMLDAGGLTTAQAAVMAIICGEEQVSQRQIASRLGQRESAVGAMAERLIKAGYITRTRSETDKRAWILEPTTAGRQALAAMGTAFAPVNALLDEAFPGEEAERLGVSLRRLIGLLEKPRMSDKDAAAD